MQAEEGRFYDLLKDNAGAPEKQREERQMEHEKERHKDGEFPVLRLVAEEVHPEQGAEAAAERGSQQEGAFGDAPAMASRFLLVRTHKDKPERID